VCIFVTHFLTAFVVARAIVDGLLTQTLTPSSTTSRKSFVFFILLIVIVIVVFVIVALLPPLSSSSRPQTKTMLRQGLPHILLKDGVERRGQQQDDEDG
jgi:hypothetical protein